MSETKRQKRHLICNAHIDPIWQWDWPEGVSAALSTFYSAVKLSKEFDFIFCHNEVTVYKFVEEYAPELFEEIRELVKQGKWHIMGGWYLQPDANMPSGESFVRQIREGQRYFKEKFGVVPTTAINFDSFGHTAGLPQIIKKCGQDSYIFMRPHPYQLTLPKNQFIWQGVDGSEIKAARIINFYNTPLGQAAEQIKNRAEIQEYDSGLVTWGVGNHGGGPSRKDLQDIEREIMPDTKFEYIHSTPERFFATISPEVTFDKSLHISMPGCYTSMHRVKRLHAELECELSIAEKACSVAYARGLMKEYPEEEIRGAVHDLLNAEFHDVLPGTSVQSGEEAGLRYLNHGMLDAERAKVKAYFALSREQAPAGEGEYPLVVFNPHPYEFCGNVECEFMLAEQNLDKEHPSFITIKDKDGNVVPYQVIKEESNHPSDWRKRVIFEAKCAPMDLTRYSAYVSFLDSPYPKRVEEFVFDDGRRHVEVDEKTGLLKSYKIDGVEYLGDGFGLYSFSDDADPWGMSPEHQKGFNTDGRAFRLMEKPSGVFESMKSVQVTENGDICLCIEAFFEDACSKARIAYKIYKNTDDVDIDVNLYLGDINKMIKLRLPVAVDGELIGQTAFGTVPLFTDGRENVSHRFVALDGGERCVALMNRNVYGSHYENGSLYMSLVRGVSYCAHWGGEQLIPTDKFTKKVDQGENNYSFRLTVCKRESLERKTAEFVQKPYAQNIFPVPADVSDKKAFDFRLGDEVVTLAALKKMDNTHNTFVFRLLNNTAGKVDTYLEVNGRRIDLSFGKYEVKTVICENGELNESYELLI